MLTEVVRAIGLVLVAEGLVFALAPRRIEEALALLMQLPLETRRLIGLVALAIGVGLVALVGVGGG